MYYDFITTPIGDIVVTVASGGALSGLYTGRQLSANLPGERSAARTAAVRREIEEYFEGTRRDFDLPLAPRGTPFQLRVWEALRQIPYGETRSYGEIAASLGVPAASRAVGRANGSNPISIVVPCHRVIGSSGDLVGYGGGLPIKRWLLEFEGSLPAAKELQATLAL
jgi:methylated-DNA-[protein]-cysteine S-methyltransferase